MTMCLCPPTNNFSHPGNLQWQQFFGPADYLQTFWASGQESFLDPGPPTIIGPDSQVYYYCFYPTNAFFQQGTPTNPQIYWLLAYAQSPSGDTNFFGWKTTTNVQHDVSVHVVSPVPPAPGSSWQPNRLPTGAPLEFSPSRSRRGRIAIMPVACAADKTVECGTSWVFDPPFVGPDSCCTNPTVTQLGVFTNINNPCNELLSAVWKITDCVGNLAYCTQYVTVRDNHAAGGHLRHQQDGRMPHELGLRIPPTATDACCGTNVTVALISTNATVFGPCLTVWSGVWQARDCCTQLQHLHTDGIRRGYYGADANVSVQHDGHHLRH